MCEPIIFSNARLTYMRQSGLTVQAGTPMTVTGNGTSLSVRRRGVPIFCLKISRGSGGRAPGYLQSKSAAA